MSKVFILVDSNGDWIDDEEYEDVTEAYNVKDYYEDVENMNVTVKTQDVDW